MLNISESSLNDEIKLNTYKSGSKVYKKVFLQNIQQTFFFFLIIGLSFLFCHGHKTSMDLVMSQL